MCARIPLPAKRRPNWTVCFSEIERVPFRQETQLYDYLKAHNCIGLTEGFARVMRNQGQYVCIYYPKDKNRAIKPCAWTRAEMLSK
jgi:hypothetical protein